MIVATLNDWERRLRPRMTQIELIGELDLSAEETAEVGRLIRTLLRSQEHWRATQELRRRYPCTFAAYLVFQGVYSYEMGNYWSAVCEATGLPRSPNHTMEWGQAFEAVVEELGLSHEFAGHRYVGAILGHGGIPSGSLPDFFEHMLQPSVTKPEWAGLSTRELIEEWLTRSPRYFVDKPVLRFLEYGGQVAEDFVERCRQMAREILETGEVPSTIDVGLPESVVACYQEWVEDPARFAPARTAGLRLRRPRIYLDPWGLGIHVLLPEQQLPATQSQGAVTWEVLADQESETVPVRVRRVDFDLKTESVPISLQRPAREYRVRLFVDGELLREWDYDGVDESHPLLVFDARTGVLLLQRKRLPGRLLWILCPPEAILQADPPDRAFIRERLPRLPWAWHAWEAHAVDLSGISQLVLHTPQGVEPIPVVADRAVQQPELARGMPVDLRDEPVLPVLADGPGSAAEVSMPLYVGPPPCLRIPWGRADSPARWRLELRHEWEAEPPCNLKATLDAFADLLRWEAEAVELPLDHPTLLGPSPLGQYRLRARGPLGSGAELRFRIVPKLVVTGHEPLYVPDPQKGAPPVQLLVETDAMSRLEPLQSDPGLHLQEVAADAYGRCYQVSVPPERTEAPLRLVYDLSPGRTVYIPLHVPVRRLRWMLALHPGQLAQQNWQDRPIAVSLRELDQSDSPYLLLEVPGANEATRIQLRFLDVDGALLQEVEALRPPVESRFRRFDLRLVRDTMRQSQSPAIRAELVLEGLPDHGTVAVPVLSLKREIYVEQVSVAPRWEGDQIYLELTWQPEVRLKWRYVRFWSQSRPWSEPLGFPIPDEARSRHTFQLPAEALPMGEYLVEFTVHDPWVLGSAPERPPANAPNVASIVLGELEGRLRQVEEITARAGQCFPYVCECLFLWHALGDNQRVGEGLQWCYEHLEDASVEHMMILAREFQDLPTTKAIQIRLLRPEWVCHTVNAYREGRLSQTGWRIYLEELRRRLSMLLITPQACQALLNVPDDLVRLAAAQQLIKGGNFSGIEAIIEWVRHGQLADDDALELLQCNLAFATHALVDHPDTPTTLRLLDALAKAHPDAVPVIFVRSSYWIRCQAGWGRIERIETPDGSEALHVHREELQQGYRLHVTLRPGEDAESVVIDAARGEIHFQSASRLYICGKCNRFVTRDNDRIYHKHEPAAHEGMGTRFRPLNTDVLHQSVAMDFAVRRPPNIWQ